MLNDTDYSFLEMWIFLLHLDEKSSFYYYPTYWKRVLDDGCETLRTKRSESVDLLFVITILSEEIIIPGETEYNRKLPAVLQKIQTEKTTKECSNRYGWFRAKESF